MVQVGSVVGDPMDIDGPWMTEAMQTAGVAEGATVSETVFEGFVGTGQMARSARFRLVWDDSTGRPASVVGKFPSDDPAARSTGFDHGTYRTEHVFYRDVADTVDVRAPRCYVTRLDEAAGAFVLIMEDLAHSQQGDQLIGLTADQASLAMREAAGLHGPRWGDPTLRAFMADRPKGAEFGTYVQTLYTMLVEPFAERLGPNLDADVVQQARDLTPHVADWFVRSDTPSTLVHLDFRPDNFLFAAAPEAPPLVVVDYQTMTDGLGMWDVGYAIGGSFEPGERARVERDLVEEYRRHLTARGVAYRSDTCWQDYRLGAVWGVIMTVLAASMAQTTERGDAMLTTMAARHGRHAIDLESLALL
jgi:type IV secretory pathway TrbD component